MAKIFEWSDIYPLGIADLDEQHKHLVDAINDLHKAIENKNDRDILAKHLQAIVDHARHHYNYEENILETRGYPEYKQHKDVHDKMVVHVVDVLKGFLDGKNELSQDFTGFLKKWLSDHILRVDRKFVPYLKEA